MSADDRAALIERIEYRLWQLDGTDLAAVALVTGLSIEELRDLGGLDVD